MNADHRERLLAIREAILDIDYGTVGYDAAVHRLQVNQVRVAELVAGEPDLWTWRDIALRYEDRLGFPRLEWIARGVAVLEDGREQIVHAEADFPVLRDHAVAVLDELIRDCPAEDEGDREPAAMPDVPLDDLVTADQAAALLTVSKRTIERYRERGDLPEPDLPGGGGRSNRWYWRNLRPALLQFRPDLPERFPASRIIG